MFRLFRKTIAPPPDPLLPVLAFIGDFERGTFNKALGYHKKNNCLMPETAALREALVNSGLIYGNEWVHIDPATAIPMSHTIAQLNANDLRITIVALVRIDRLAEGFILSAVCQNGMMLAALKRLQTLHEAGEIAPLLHRT